VVGSECIVIKVEKIKIFEIYLATESTGFDDDWI
jgi:hypothetical protein